MSKESCIIDGKDIADFGMFILKGGDYDLLPFPERIEPTQNDWYEEDGVDVDLSEVFFKSKNVTLNFYISADTVAEFEYNLDYFHRLISKPKPRKFYIREFGKEFALRYISCPSYTQNSGLLVNGRKSGEISVNFTMDNPLHLFSKPQNLIPNISRPSLSYVEINDYDLSKFGIIVNQCYNTALNLSGAKEPLVKTFEKQSGADILYPEDAREIRQTLKNKQIVIKCTMIADSRETFYYNYEALFNNLTKPEPILLSTQYEDFECYYSAMQNFEKLEPFSKRIKVKFDLVLTIVKPNRPVRVLAAEDGRPMMTEDGRYLILI
ncbi:hypothetical protein [Prevotella sp. 10(H)]|uniref:hypothetical protein n=1 Tax=Prevotella sp. 10(H) TaxID=1158294 RepID=UPI0004A76D98|nr:hypothetical protein [Prevotella sp. 10(H)]